MFHAIETIVGEPATPDTLITHALATARESALLTNTSREINLRAAQVEVERWCGRLLWPASVTPADAARPVDSVVEVSDVVDFVPVCPARPVTSGATISVTSVERWSDALEAYEAVEYILRPSGLLRLRTIGLHRIVATITPAAAPAIAEEGCCRLWAFREVRRPSYAGTEGGSDRLSNAMYLSGASGILRSLKQKGQM